MEKTRKYISIIMFIILFALLSYSQSFAQRECYFLIDTSGSMEGRGGPDARNVLANLRLALIRYTESLPLGTVIKVRTFDRGIQRRFERTINNEGDRNDLNTFFVGISARGRETYLYSSLREIFDEADRSETTKKEIWLFTDGMDTEVRATNRTAALQETMELFQKMSEDKKHPLLYYVKLGEPIPEEERNIIEETKGAKPINPDPQKKGPVEIVPPHAVFSYVQTNKPYAVKFSNESRGIFNEWVWSFDDGNTSREENPIHVFSKAGTYNVKLTVTGDQLNDSTEQKVRVEPPVALPKANFSYELKGPYKIEFQNLSKNVGDWTWDFGDGTTDREENPIHVFSKTGTYRVKLAVSGPGGRDEKVEDIVVKEPPPPWLKWLWIGVAAFFFLIGLIIVMCAMRTRFDRLLYLEEKETFETAYFREKQGFCDRGVTFGGGNSKLNFDTLHETYIYFTPASKESVNAKILTDGVILDGEVIEKNKTITIYTDSTITVNEKDFDFKAEESFYELDEGEE